MLRWYHKPFERKFCVHPHFRLISASFYPHSNFISPPFHPNSSDTLPSFYSHITPIVSVHFNISLPSFCPHFTLILRSFHRHSTLISSTFYPHFSLLLPAFTPFSPHFTLIFTLIHPHSLSLCPHDIKVTLIPPNVYMDFKNTLLIFLAFFSTFTLTWSSFTAKVTPTVPPIHYTSVSCSSQSHNILIKLPGFLRCFTSHLINAPLSQSPLYLHGHCLLCSLMLSS